MGKRIAVPLGIALLSLLSAPGFAAEIRIGNFGAGDLSGWERKVFRGETSYAIVSDNGVRVLRADSRASASGLYRKVDLDPVATPWLTWSWKIRGTLRKGDERTKSGDDYAARVYVVFPRFLFFRTRAINYIWANRVPVGTFLPNAYTGNAVMVAVESGDGNAGRWIPERRDVREDYRKAFGEEPPRIGAIAVMTDTDNTGEEATAWYGDIVIRSDE